LHFVEYTKGVIITIYYKSFGLNPDLFLPHTWHCALAWYLTFPSTLPGHSTILKLTSGVCFLHSFEWQCIPILGSVYDCFLAFTTGCVSCISSLFSGCSCSVTSDVVVVLVQFPQALY